MGRDSVVMTTLISDQISLVAGHVLVAVVLTSGLIVEVSVPFVKPQFLSQV